MNILTRLPIIMQGCNVGTKGIYRYMDRKIDRCMYVDLLGVVEACNVRLKLVLVLVNGVLLIDGFQDGIRCTDIPNLTCHQ
jgi:hypothetical protein